MELNELLLRTAFACMSCDGDVASEEIEQIKNLAKDRHFFGDVDVDKELSRLVNEIKLEGAEFLKKYLKTLSEQTLTEDEELKVANVAVQTIQADCVVKYSEIKFFKVLRSNLKIVKDERLQNEIDNIDDNYFSQDICSDYLQMYDDYFNSIDLAELNMAEYVSNPLQDNNKLPTETIIPTPSSLSNSSGTAIVCKDVPDGRIFFHTIDRQKRIPNIEDFLNRHARSVTGEHMKELAEAAHIAPKEHLPAYYVAAAYYYFYIQHNPFVAYYCCVSTLSLLSCMSKYDLILPEYQWIAHEPELSSMLFDDGPLGINQHYKQFFSLDVISGRHTGILSAPILPDTYILPKNMHTFPKN